LAKSRVDITRCQHGNVGKFISLCFFVLYYKTNIKHFFRIDIQLYQHSWKLGKLPISTRVDITVYQHGKCFIFVNYNIAFVNSERRLAKSRVDITRCQHGNAGKFLSLYFFVLYYKTNIKHLFRIDI
jgi:hypothetical protein